MLDELLDEQSVIKYGSMFLQLDRNVTVDRIKKLIGKKVYMDVFNDDNKTVSNYYAIIKSVSENNKVSCSYCIFCDDSNLSFFDIPRTEEIKVLALTDIRALEEIKNYNTRNFDFDKLMNKKVLLTDMHDRQEIVVILDYDVDSVFLLLYAEDKNHNVYESYDYDFPKCFIKDIEIID